MYKLVAIDMDGTLLNSEKQISQRNRKAITDAVKAGAMVVIATGRGYVGIESHLKDLGLNVQGQYTLAMNGGAAYDSYTGKAVTSLGLKGKDLHRIYDLSQELNLKIQAYTLDECLAIEDNEFTEFERVHVGTPVKILESYKDISEDDDIMKVLLMGEPAFIDSKIKLIPEEFSRDYTMVKSLPMCLEIMNKNCNKGIGLKELAHKLGVKQEEVIAIGDEQNDFEMIKFAGLGVAMGNANQIIKDVANYETKTNDEDGVALVIEKFILNK
ncbi:MAG: Cof-type HAD-IIB family hydrolase [Sarcina sp.]